MLLLPRQRKRPHGTRASRFPWWGGSALFVAVIALFITYLWLSTNGHRQTLTVRVLDKRYWYTRSPKTGAMLSQFQVETDQGTFSGSAATYDAYKSLAPGHTYRIEVETGRLALGTAHRHATLVRVLSEVPSAQSIPVPNP